MQRYFDAIEGGDGGALFECCSADAQLFDTEGGVFMDFSTLATAEATAADLASKMGPCQLRYTIVSRDAEALVEVVGDAAVVVDEATPEAWAAAVTDARRRRDDLVARGRRRRRAFTVEVSGRALTSAYHQAVDS